MTTTTAHRRRTQATTKPKVVRVATYTRKSVDKGNGEALSSIDSQREIVEAFITSQREQGWNAIPTRYDDLGVSGATTKRPAFERLLADIETGRVDAVAVYRLDRLTRSQADLFRLLEFFDRHDVTFVSVTEQFNTTTPMGRFALGILGVVAQLEREVTAERIRDKVSVSRQHGQWTGGRPILGYDIMDKRLVVNEPEGEQVRQIFALYINGHSVAEVANELQRRTWRLKTFVNRRGQLVQGRPFDKGAVRRLLGNPLYAGMVRDGDELHDGEHKAVVDAAAWKKAQRLLAQNDRPAPTREWNALLTGLLTCGVCGSAMGHHYTSRRGKRYGSYVCQRLQKGGRAACPGSRIPVGKMDRYIMERLRTIGRDEALLAESAETATAEWARRRDELTAEVQRLKAEQRRSKTERASLVQQAAEADGSPDVSPRLAELDEAAAETKRLIAAARSELTRLEQRPPDSGELKGVLGDFEAVWEELFHDERARLLRLLVESVAYDASADRVTITYREDGPQALLAEIQS